MSALLEVRDLRTWFPIRRGVFSRTVGHVRALDGVSLDLAEGETLGIVGESGCGKTTLARTILRLDPPHSGAVRFEGRDVLALRARELQALRRSVQVVFQDPYSSLNPRMTAQDIVTEGPRQHGTVAAADVRAAALELLADVGLGADALTRYPHEFSGGQRQRIGVARALSMRPRLVICDEAVSALDVSVQAQVLNLLADLRDRHRLSYLFISHDLGVVRHICDRVAVMYLGRVVETGPCRDVIDRPRHPYTSALVSAIPRVGSDRAPRRVLGGDVPSPARPPPGCRFHPRCPFATSVCRTTEQRLEPLAAESPDRQIACVRRNEIDLSQRP